VPAVTEGLVKNLQPQSRKMTSFTGMEIKAGWYRLMTIRIFQDNIPTKKVKYFNRMTSTNGKKLWVP
jgi:hypothetical protein